MADRLQAHGAEGAAPSVNRDRGGESADSLSVNVPRTDGAGETRHAEPVDGPMPSRTPTAAKLLAAAQQVLVKKGFGGLTLKAIAEVSGENPAMVQYYFGNKAGLVKAMIESIVRDDSLDVAAVMSSVTGDDLLPKFVEGLEAISSSRSFRVFFDILPYALRHEQLRSRMAEVYEWYRRIKLEWLRVEDREPPQHDALLGFAELMVATVDGLAIQKALDQGFDLARPYAVLEFMLRKCLPELLGGDLGQKPSPGSAE